MDVVVLLLRGGLASTAIAPMEVFTAAGVVWNQLVNEPAQPPFNVRTASVTGGAVAADGPLSIVPSTSIDAIGRADLVLVPATGIETDLLLERHGAVVPWLRSCHERGAAIAGVCSGVALLAEAGLLDGRPATTHWGLAERYRRKYPAVDWQPERFVTEADGVYCGGGVYASLDLSLYLVEKFAGHEVAVQCAKSLLIDTPRTWQSGYSSPPRRRDHTDEKIHAAQAWLRSNCDGSFSFEELAARVNMSPRNFARRFKQATGETPLVHLHKLRIARAKALLERDRRTIQEIARAVGYEDVLFFRRLFKRYAGVTPQEYRKRFGPAGPLTENQAV